MGKTKVKIMFWAVLILIIGFISPARMAKADEENESGEQPTIVETGNVALQDEGQDSPSVDWISDEMMANAIPLTDGMTISADDEISFLAMDSNGTTKEIHGVLLKISVLLGDYLKCDFIDGMATYTIHKIENYSDPIDIRENWDVSPNREIIECYNNYSEEITFFICVDIHDEYGFDSEITPTVITEYLFTWEDILDQIPKLTEGYNPGLDKKCIRWYENTSDGRLYKEARMVKFVVPSGKSISFDDFEGTPYNGNFYDGDCQIYEIDERGYASAKIYDFDIGNLYNPFDGSINHYFKIYDADGNQLEDKKISNHSSYDKTYYLFYTEFESSFTISYSDCDVTVDPDPDDDVTVDLDDIDNLDKIAVPLTDGMVLHEEDKVNFYARNFMDSKELVCGALLYIDVPYKTYVSINDDNDETRYLVKNTGNHPMFYENGNLQYLGGLYPFWQDESVDTVRYYIAVIYPGVESPITLHIDSYELGTFEDIVDLIPVLVDGYNSNLDKAQFEWVERQGINRITRRSGIAKLIVPAGKSLIIEDVEEDSYYDYSYYYIGEIGESGEIANSIYVVENTNIIDENTYFNYLTMYDFDYTKSYYNFKGNKIENNRIDNHSDTDKEYYLRYSDHLKSITISYADCASYYNLKFYYDYPGGTPEGYSDYCEYETTGEFEIYPELAENRAEIDNYRFVGWADKNGSILPENTILNTNEDLEIHGVWEKSIKTGFFEGDDYATYYADENGNICTGWRLIDSKWYYFGTDGKLQRNWINYGGSWYYSDATDGFMLTGLQYIQPNWYYFTQSGIMKTGWQVIGGQWYYFSTSGARKTGWVQIDGYWYYFNSDGIMAPSGWQIINGITYYFTKSGAMKIGWQEIDGTWFYFTKSGAKATGWQNINGTWYYFDLDGLMYTGWLTQGKVKYYFTPSGAMKIGWCKIDNDWYYFKPSGAMAVNEIIDGYKIGADGKMK